MSDETRQASWWHTLPGILTAVAGVVTAVTGLIVAASQAGFFEGRDNSQLDVESVTASAVDEQDGNRRHTADQKSSGLIVGSVRNQPATIRGIDRPLAADVGTTYKITLDANEETYFRFTAPGETKLLLDMRLPANEHSNLQSRVLLLDEDGAPVGNPVVNFNEIDIGHRMVASLPLKEGKVAGLKVLNGNKLSDLWLTLLPAQSNRFVRLFGEIVPKPLAGGAASGTLDAKENVYYATALAGGSYKIVLDFATADGKNTNLQGYLALLDADGGGQRTVIPMNEVDVSYRKTETFTLLRDQTIIVRIYNQVHPVNYTVRIVRV
jgi:hypothetical protein